MLWMPSFSVPVSVSRPPTAFWRLLPEPDHVGEGVCTGVLVAEPGGINGDPTPGELNLPGSVSLKNTLMLPLSRLADFPLNPEASEPVRFTDGVAKLPLLLLLPPPPPVLLRPTLSAWSAQGVATARGRSGFCPELTVKKDVIFRGAVEAALTAVGSTGRMSSNVRVMRRD